MRYFIKRIFKKIYHRSIVALSVLILLFSMVAWAQQKDDTLIIWRIASIKTGNALFSISSSIAANISLPYETRNSCTSTHCGVRSLVALARTRTGIIELLREVVLQKTESAILPLDIVYAAYNNQLISMQGYPYQSLRLLAPVTSLPVHIIVHEQSGISSIDDVAGNVVAFVPDADRTAATHFNRILQAYNIDNNDVDYVFLDSQAAKAALVNDDVQILVMTGQDPIPEIRDLDREHKIIFLELHPQQVEKILKDWPYFYTRQQILTDSYTNQFSNTLTLGTSYVWVTSEDSDEKIVHDMVRALWHPGTRKLLRSLNPNATMPENLRGDLLLIEGLQYHQGAVRYYQDNGYF
ncbi:MAG: TAXI family TRAP transporter solute-binding subunit [Alphaproteobacteria bacterium]|nr:TAXI family TRAP transporter solute-binding subunit [Alphaproteobacteria bacterium]